VSTLRLRDGCLAVAVLALLPSAAYAAAARVDFAIGEVVAINPAGQHRGLRKGDTIEQGDTVRTNGGRAQLRFTDGAYVALQPDTLFRVDRYHFEGRADGSERGWFSLLAGGMRTITGLVGRSNKRNYQVQTRVATIGIRGTEYQLRLDSALTGSVGAGEIGVCNAAGCLGIADGQSFVVLDRSTRPAVSLVRTSFAPPQPGRLQSPLGAGQEGNAAAAPPAQVTQLSPAVNRAGGAPAQSGGNTGSSGGGSVATPPQVGQLASGRGYALAYARDSGPDSIGSTVIGVTNNSDATFDAMDRLSSYTAPSGIDLRQHAPSVAGSGADSLIGWGTWTGEFVDAGAQYVLGANQGMHYAIGKPAPAPQINQGFATFDLLGATRPTGTDNSAPGTLSAASLWVNFTTARVDLAMQVDYGARSYALDTRNAEGALMQLNRGHASFEGASLPTGGCANAAACGTNVRGVVVGEQAQRAALAYQINDGAYPTNDGIDGARALSRPAALASDNPAVAPLSIHGAAAFTRVPGGGD
jgi:hypothetical protein